MKKAVLLLLATVFLLSLCGCRNKAESKADDPAHFLQSLDTAVQADPAKAKTDYLGTTCQMIVKIGWVTQGTCANFETDHLRIAAYLPPKELEDLRYGSVCTIEATIESFEEGKGRMEITARPAQIVKDVYQVSGEIEGIYYDFSDPSAGERPYCAIRDKSIMAEHEQINVYLSPDEVDNYAVGDVITAEGRLSLAPMSMGSAILPTTNQKYAMNVLNLHEAEISKKQVE